MGITKRTLAGGRHTWEICYRVGSRWVHERAGADRREAERLLARRLREVKDGTWQPARIGARLTLAAFGADWLARRTNRSKAADETRWRLHVLTRAWLADLPCVELRPRHYRQLAEEIAGTMAGKSASNVLGLLRTMSRDMAALELASDWAVGLPRGLVRRRPESPRTAYLPDECARLLALEGIDGVFAALALYTGCREGELCGLRVRHLDWHASPLPALEVAEQYDGQPLKGDDGERCRPRRVPVHPDLARVLAAWLTQGGWEREVCRVPGPADFILPNRHTRSGGHTRSSAYKWWRRIVERAGVPNRSLHSTRHTMITRLRQVADRGLVERITHNAAGTVLDAYTHWEWDPLCAAVSRLELATVPRPADAPPEVEPWRRWLR